MSQRPFRFAVQAANAPSWIERRSTAGKVERLGINHVIVQQEQLAAFAPVVAARS
jgi:hypothetical protein